MRLMRSNGSSDSIVPMSPSHLPQHRAESSNIFASSRAHEAPGDQLCELSHISANRHCFSPSDLPGNRERWSKDPKVNY